MGLIILSKRNRVNVTLNLRGNFEKTLSRLEGRLDKISGKTIRPDLEIREDREIAGTKGKLDGLSKSKVTPRVVVKKGDIAATKAKIKTLSGTERVIVRVDEIRGNKVRRRALQSRQALRKSDTRDKLRKEARRGTRRHLPGRRPFGGTLGSDFDQMNRRIHQQSRTKSRVGRGALAGRLLTQKIFDNQAVRRTDSDNIKSTRRRQIGNLGRRKSRTRDRRGIDASGRLNFTERLRKRGIIAGGGSDGGGGSYGGGRGRRRGPLNRLIPSGRLSNMASSMMMVIALSVAEVAGGILTAWAGHLTAMGGIVGLGSLGFGETAAQSMHLAEVRSRIFGRELFENFRPTTTHFAPVTDELFQTLPSRLGQLNDPLQGFDVYVDSIDPSIDGIIDWTERAINSIVDLNEEITQLSFRFGSLVGHGIIDLLEYLVIAAHEGQDEFLQIAVAVHQFLRMILQLAVVWGQVMAVLMPLFVIIRKVVEIFDNRLGVTVLQIIVFFMLLAKAINAGAAAYLGLKAAIAGGTLVKSIAGVLGLSSAYKALSASIAQAAVSKAGLLALTGVGLLGVGAAVAAMSAMSNAMTPDFDGGGEFGSTGGDSPSPSGMGGGGGGGGQTVTQITNFHMNVEGDTDKHTMDSFKDMAAHEANNQMDIRENQSKD